MQTDATDLPAVVSMHVPDLPGEERRALKAETKAEAKTEATDLPSDYDDCDCYHLADALRDEKFEVADRLHGDECDQHQVVSISINDDIRELHQLPGPASGDTTSS